MIWLYGYCFLVGACFGSFVYASTQRYVHKENFITGRSCCPHCHHPLAAIDLIPVLSWLWLRGRCRYCGEPIALRYWLFELGIGLAACCCCFAYGFSIAAIWTFLLILILVSIAMIDHELLMIPNGLQLLLVIPVAALSWGYSDFPFVDRLIGALSVSGFMILMNQWKKDSFGGGDIKLMLLCGWLLGWQGSVMAMVIAVWTAGIYAIYLLLTKQAQRDSHMAFAPYLCGGVLLVLLFDKAVLMMHGLSVIWQ